MTHPTDDERRKAGAADDYFYGPSDSAPMIMPLTSHRSVEIQGTVEQADIPPDPGLVTGGGYDFDEASAARFLMWCMVIPFGLLIMAAIGLLGYMVLAWLFPYF